MRRKHRMRRASKRWLDADCPSGVLAIFDNKRSIDRYTVFYAEPITDDGETFAYVAMNASPFSPQGFGQHGELSAYHVACIIKGYADQGGWGSESLEFIADKGISSAEFWPMQSTARSNDKPEMWANAKLHVCTEWYECSKNAAERRLQVMTALLLGLPVIGDYNWWSHSVCPCRLMSPQKIRIWNSWGDSWSDKGMGDLENGKAWPDDAWVPRVMTAATV